MLKILVERWKQGHRTARFPREAPVLPDRFRGLPVIDASKCPDGCRACIEACPTGCILPNRTIDAGRCISYLTIELKDDISPALRPLVGGWVFGCDICQMVCPWNRFAAQEGDPAFAPRVGDSQHDLTRELKLSPKEFNNKFKNSPIQRAKRRGYLRNIAVALGNEGQPEFIPMLEVALKDTEPMVRSHAAWAIKKIQKHDKYNESFTDRHQ